MSKTGFLLVNLGTPDHANASAIKKYLSEFLMDKKVIGAPLIVRWVLVNLIIIPLRIHKVVEKYQSVWLNNGSPLLVYSNLFYDKLKKISDSNLNIKLAMRYGAPSIESAIDQLKNENVAEINLIPLYPQYAEATTGTIIEKVNELLNKKKWTPKLNILKYFFDKKEYIDQNVNLIKKSFEDNSSLKNSSKILLFSFHGLPESHIKQIQGCEINSECCKKIDSCSKLCYRAQCIKTAESIATQLQLSDNEWTVSFQSRVGPTKWIGPSTDSEIKRIATFAKEQKIHLFVYCPSFVVDCLETLEEINIEARKIFLLHGGETFTYIPCLNDNENWVDAFSKLMH